MDVPRSLKKTNPQKYYMKMICNAMYYLGFGSCWYEDRVKSVLQTRIYLAWAALTNFYTMVFLLNEFLANFRKDLNEQEQNDVIHFNVAHSTILGKIICYYIYKNDIRMFLMGLLEDGRFTFVSEEINNACVKRFVTLCVAFVGSSYSTVISKTVDGIKVYFTDGIPIRAEVLYYPTSSDTGLIVNILRFLSLFHWFFIVAVMLVIDCLCICSLVIVGYKFKILQAYFESLRNKVLENEQKKSRRELEEQFRRDFVVGIEMHEDALWCSKNIQFALGKLFSVQAVESVVLLGMCLLKLVLDERTLVLLLANLFFILCLIVVTGAYMMAGGDITHEASKLSQAIFNSGWELVGSGRAIRILVVLTLQRSQVPIYMWALGILTLSYNNFISVCRSSYSFFAVMY